MLNEGFCTEVQHTSVVFDAVTRPARCSDHLVDSASRRVSCLIRVATVMSIKHFWYSFLCGSRWLQKWDDNVHYCWFLCFTAQHLLLTSGSILYPSINTVHVFANYSVDTGSPSHCRLVKGAQQHLSTSPQIVHNTCRVSKTQQAEFLLHLLLERVHPIPLGLASWLDRLLLLMVKLLQTRSQCSW